MQTYPTFYPQMNNNCQMPIQNPYIERMTQLQQYQQSLQQPIVPTQMSGANQFNPFVKIVESIDIVKVTDIPMDGNMYYFPQADGQAIYGKKFLPNAQTQILTFKPVFEDNPNNVSSGTEKLKISLSDEVTDVFMKRFDELEKRIDDLMPKKTTSRVKRESEEE